MPDNNYKKAKRLRDFESKYILRKEITWQDVPFYQYMGMWTVAGLFFFIVAHL